jgi:hypothetical protein
MPDFHRLMSRGNPVTISGRPYTSDNLCDITDADRKRLALIQIAHMTDPDELRGVYTAAATRAMAMVHGDD